MASREQFSVIQVSRLEWPPSLSIPSSRFRLFVAADTDEVAIPVLSAFARAALKSGMVYFCSWGRGCERFHDIVDEIVVEDELGERRFIGAHDDDVIMTTWHADEGLEEALEFFAKFAAPTDGFSTDSSFRLVICLDNAQWAGTANQFSEAAEFFV